MCFIITGSESQHYELRSSIIVHMFSIPELLIGRGADGHRNYLTYYHGGYHSVEDYLNRTSMAEEGTWGTDFEMCLLAHMLGSVVYSYKAGQYWIACIVFPKELIMLCLKMFLKDHSIFTTQVTILMLLLGYYPECDDSDVISTVSV